MVSFHPALSSRVSTDIVTLGLYEFWYRATQYDVSDDSLVINRGIMSRRETKIPGDKINAVKTKLSPLMGTSAVRIDTGSADTIEAVRLTRKNARLLAHECNTLKERATAHAAA
jgi:uncharacterized membrane protein YdbT with pleckstrin-like domain